MSNPGRGEEHVERDGRRAAGRSRRLLPSALQGCNSSQGILRRGCRPPGHLRKVDHEMFYSLRGARKAARTQIMGDFNYLDIDGHNKCAANHKGKPVARGESEIDLCTAC